MDTQEMQKKEEKKDDYFRKIIPYEVTIQNALNGYLMDAPGILDSIAIFVDLMALYLGIRAVLTNQPVSGAASDRAPFLAGNIHNIRIVPTCNGGIIAHIGCSTFCYPSADTFLKRLKKYLFNQEEFHRRYAGAFSEPLGAPLNVTQTQKMYAENGGES